MNECWLPSVSNISFENYSCLVKSRRKRRNAKRDSGGICIIIKNDVLNYFENVDWSFEDGFILKSKCPCTANGKFLYCIFVYLKPSNSSRNELVTDLDDFDVLSEKICELRANAELLVFGDLNARTSTLCDFYDTSSLSNNDYSPDLFDTNNYVTNDDFTLNNLLSTRKNKDKKTNDYGHKLINLCKQSGMIICNGRVKGDFEGEFTYIDKKGKSSIDYALASKGLFHHVNTFSVHEQTVFSDHSPVNLHLKNIVFIDTFNNTTSSNKPFTSSYRWSTVENEDVFISNMSDAFSVDSLNCIIDVLQNDFNHYDTCIIDECMQSLNNVLEYAALPFKHNSFTNTIKSFSNKNKQSNPWYDIECKLKRKEFDTAIMIYKDTPSADNLTNLTFIRNTYRKLCRKKHNDYLSELSLDLVQLSKTNPKDFWKKIKRKKRKNIGNCNFDLYFKNLFESNTSELSENSHNKLQEFDSNYYLKEDLFLDKDIDLAELNVALKRLKNNKSPGSDHIINEFLKYNTTLFKEALLAIFNAIFKTGHFPKAWTVGLITPIHKKGDLNSAENYRGITLLSCVGKLFTSILNLRLNKWAEANDKFDDFQHGFREKKGTIDAMFLLQTTVDIFLSKHDALYVSFIDLRKAFDKTHHTALWYKLYNNDVSSKIIAVIKNMYAKIKLCVKTTYESYVTNDNKDDCLLSDLYYDCVSRDCNSVNNDFFFSPVAGVLQGESLSPFLFSMFLNDLQDFMKTDPNVGISIYQFFMILILFADDMVFFSDNRFGLQKSLDKFYDYCANWGLEVNVEKTKCMVFKNGGKKHKFDKWYYNGQEIETVTEFKYLGFLFSSSGKFKIGLDNLLTRGEKALFDMKSSIENFNVMQFDMKMNLFDSLVKSVICYACELWGFCEAKRLETFHLSFLKSILGVRKTTPTCYIYKECKTYPLYITRILRIIKFWIKIVLLDDLSPIKLIYNTAMELDEKLETPVSHWISEVKNTLFKHGFGYIWLNQQFLIDFSFFPIFKERLLESFWQDNNSLISDLSPHRLYRHLSDNSSVYLKLLPNNHIRKSLTKLRLGSHHFMVERGRWANLEFIDRICFTCNEVEDEYHVVMTCRKYDDIRSKHLPTSLYKRPSMFKFVEYLNTEDVNCQKKLGLFMFYVFKIYEKDELFA